MENNKSENLVQIDNNLEDYTEHLFKLSGLVGRIDLFDPDLKISEFKEVQLLSNFNAIFLISILDTLEIQKGILTAKTKWDRIYFAKNAYLTIYETVNSLDKINSLINKIINENYPHLKDNYSKIRKDLRTFRSNHSFENKIKEIRNNVAGHIEPNLKKYFDIIDKLNSDDAIKLGFDFCFILMNLLKLTADIAEDSNTKIEQKFI